MVPCHPAPDLDVNSPRLTGEKRPLPHGHDVIVKQWIAGNAALQSVLPTQAYGTESWLGRT